LFLPTPSARRATSAGSELLSALGDFYPRPPRGGRRDAAKVATNYITISTHALREEGDRGNAYNADNVTLFLPTPSASRATRWPCPSAPLPRNFYPRHPRGGRPYSRRGPLSGREFLPTPSASRATPHPMDEIGQGQFLPTPSARRATLIFCTTVTLLVIS